MPECSHEPFTWTRKAWAARGLLAMWFGRPRLRRHRQRQDAPTRQRQVALDRKRLSSGFVIAIISSGCRSARARIPRVLLDTDDTKPMGKRHRHDTEGM